MTDIQEVPCEWMVRTYYGEPRACGRFARHEPDGVAVCWQHHDILVRAGLSALTSGDIGPDLDWAVDNAIAAFLDRRVERSEGRPVAETRLADAVARVVQMCDERGIDLSDTPSLGDLIESRLKTFSGGLL